MFFHRRSHISLPLLRDPRTRPNSVSRSGGDVGTIEKRLRTALPHLREKYAVERLALHGSRVRGKADTDSDIDILVDFQDTEAGRKVSLFDFIALKQELKALLDMPVDLGERTALRRGARETILREAETV